MGAGRRRIDEIFNPDGDFDEADAPGAAVAAAGQAPRTPAPQPPPLGRIGGCGKTEIHIHQRVWLYGPGAWIVCWRLLLCV